MSEATFPQVQQIWTFWEKTTKDNVDAALAAIDTSVAVSKASLAFAAQVSEYWTKLASDTAHRLTKTA
jgi:hypothetical protein